MKTKFFFLSTIFALCMISCSKCHDKSTVKKVDKAISKNEIKVAASILHDWYLECRDKNKEKGKCLAIISDRANKVTELALAEDDLASAQIVATDFLDRGKERAMGTYNTTLVLNYMLEQEMYEEALEYSQYWKGDNEFEDIDDIHLDESYIRAISDIITYMCKKGKVAQARNFAEQMVASMNPKYYNSSDPASVYRYIVKWKKDQIHVLMQVVDAYK